MVEILPKKDNFVVKYQTIKKQIKLYVLLLVRIIAN